MFNNFDHFKKATTLLLQEIKQKPSMKINEFRERLLKKTDYGSVENYYKTYCRDALERSKQLLEFQILKKIEKMLQKTIIAYWGLYDSLALFASINITPKDAPVNKKIKGETWIKSEYLIILSIVCISNAIPSGTTGNIGLGIE